MMTANCKAQHSRACHHPARWAQQARCAVTARLTPGSLATRCDMVTLLLGVWPRSAMMPACMGIGAQVAQRLQRFTAYCFLRKLPKVLRYPSSEESC